MPDNWCKVDFEFQKYSKRVGITSLMRRLEIPTRVKIMDRSNAKDGTNQTFQAGNMFKNLRFSDDSYLERLRHVCLRAFGEEHRSVPSFFSNNPTMLQRQNAVHETKISLSDIDNMSQFMSITEASSNRTSGTNSRQSFSNRLQMSCDSGISVNQKTSVTSDIFKAENDQMLSAQENPEELHIQNISSRHSVTTIVHSENATRANSFSNNYSLFCQNLSQLKAESDEVYKARTSVNIFGSHQAFHSISRIETGLVDDKKLESKGNLKLSLQSFPVAKQLRVILHNVDETVVNNCKVFCKIALTADKKTLQKEKSKRHKVVSKRAIFKEELYFNATEEDLLESFLQISLYRVSKILRRPVIVGEARIDLESLDLSLDTTLEIMLRQSDLPKDVLDDVLVLSEDKSINAEVMASLSDNGSQRCRTTASTLRRTYSTPEYVRNSTRRSTRIGYWERT